MSRIDRYISFVFLPYFFGSLFVFACVFLAVDALSTMVTYEHVGLSTLTHYYLLYLPETMYRMVPVASLTAMVFTLSALNRSNELVALYSTGMSLVRITAPIILWVSLFCVLALMISDRALPGFTRQRNFVFYHEIRKNPSLYSMVKTNKIWYRSKDTIFYLKTLNEKNHTAQGLMLYYFDDAWNLMQMITAKEVELRGKTWKLRDGSVTIFTDESSFPLTSDFKSKVINMGEEAKDISTSVHAADVLSLGELSEFIRKNKEAGLDTLRYEADYHSKFAFALAGLVMALLGVPFSVGRARSGGFMLSVGKSIGLVFVYWAFLSSSLTLAYHGQLNPIVAAWAPNLFMGSVAAFFIRKLKQ